MHKLGLEFVMKSFGRRLHGATGGSKLNFFQISRRKTRATRLRLNISHMVEHRLCDDIKRAGVYMFPYSILLSSMSNDMSACFLSLSHALELDPKLWHSPDALV